MGEPMFDMKLNESIADPSIMTVITRVPGGWIYRFYHIVDLNQEFECAVFVPEVKDG